jgi:8-oxo-dGTP pyrophosphatase MutT (NUDIX family)
MGDKYFPWEHKHNRNMSRQPKPLTTKSRFSVLKESSEEASEEASEESEEELPEEQTEETKEEIPEPTRPTKRPFVKPVEEEPEFTLPSLSKESFRVLQERPQGRGVNEGSIRVTAVLFTINRWNELFTLLIFQDCDRWSFPKGGIEEGESHQEALFREVYEETSINLARVSHEILHRETVIANETHDVFYVLITKDRSCFDEVPVDIDEACVTKWVRMNTFGARKYLKNYKFNKISRILLTGILDARNAFKERFDRERNFLLTKMNERPADILLDFIIHPLERDIYLTRE